jgi:hypothetical protein
MSDCKEAAGSADYLMARLFPTTGFAQDHPVLLSLNYA